MRSHRACIRVSCGATVVASGGCRMATSSVERRNQNGVRRAKPLVLAAIAITYASNYWRTPQVRDAVLLRYHLASYERWGVLVPHLFLYTTITAALSAIFWF